MKTTVVVRRNHLNNASIVVVVVLNPNGTLGNGTRVLVPCVVRAALAGSIFVLSVCNRDINFFFCSGDGGTAKEMHELADKVSMLQNKHIVEYMY